MEVWNWWLPISFSLGMINFILFITSLFHIVVHVWYIYMYNLKGSFFSTHYLGADTHGRRPPFLGTNIFCPQSRQCLNWTSVGRWGRGQCSMYGILKLIKPILQNIHCFRGQVNIQYYWLCLHIGKRETESIDVITSIIIIIFINMKQMSFSLKKENVKEVCP